MFKTKKINFVLLLVIIITISGCSFNYNDSSNYSYSRIADRITSFSTQPPVTQTFIESEKIETTTDELNYAIEDEELFEIFYENLSNYNTHFTVKGTIEANQVAHILKEIRYRYPELFWSIDGGKMTINKNTEVNLEILNNYTVDQLKSMTEALLIRVKNITDLLNPEWSDYDKVLFVHDYIIDHTTYDYNTADTHEPTIGDTAYGCLMNGEAVCGGYSKAFNLIMNTIGIESGTIHGPMDGVSHAWNYVKIEGDYYWLDLTNDDQEVNGYKDKYMRHGYFLMNDDMLFKTHAVDYEWYSEISIPILIPTCSSLTYNYYVYNNCYYSVYSFEEIESRTSSQGNNNYIELMFANKEEYEKCITDLFSKDKYGRIKIYQLSIFKNRKIQLQYCTEDCIYALEFSVIM